MPGAGTEEEGCEMQVISMSIADPKVDDEEVS